jgi:hypothetical protein
LRGGGADPPSRNSDPTIEFIHILQLVFRQSVKQRAAARANQVH